MDSMTFILFGSTGDLAKRKIYPALFHLYLTNKLPDSFSLIGVGRRNLTDLDFQSKIIRSINTFSRYSTADDIPKYEFSKAFHYCQMDICNKDEYAKLLEAVCQNEKDKNIRENRLFYLSVAPDLFEIVATNIKDSGLGEVNGWKRLIIEKPFGHNLKSAQDLNEKLSRSFEDNEIYRIDHYLGKPMVKTLEALTFANPILQSLWNNRFISNVQITASETVGVEKRAAYYDKAGAIRDMVQNHLMQLVMMTAMHLPKCNFESDILNEKRRVMEALRPINKETVGVNVVRGQYDRGVINGIPVVAYVEEPGIDASSQNDTFIAARLWIDSALWEGVPFYIRTGKRLAEKTSKVVIEFKSQIQCYNSPDINKIKPNLLTIKINPDEGVALQLNIKNPTNGEMEPINVDFSAVKHEVPEAYELLLLDALLGDSTFFAHWKEVELSWKWVQPILDAFQENSVKLHLYPSGSMGPEAANLLLEDQGFQWW